MISNNAGVLLTNIGTPAEPTTAVVKQYLKKFLSDRRVIEIHPLIWQPILRGLILPFRSHKSAKLYQKIWTDKGSPLEVNSQLIANKLKIKLGRPVELGMHYSQPSVKQALESLRTQNCNKIIILPLFPQYSSAATGSSFDLVMETLKTWRKVPEVHFIDDYADNPTYIQAVAKSVNSSWHLLFSFHGITQSATFKGDPYNERCHLTAQLIANQLNLKPDQWSISFQSRLGRAKWLEPYTDQVLKKLPKQGVKKLSVICPGFAADCLETLEEIAIRGKEQFYHAGGEEFNYIPALNDSDEHIEALSSLCDLS